MPALLELAGITVRFGGVVAISQLDLRVDAGALFAHSEGYIHTNSFSFVRSFEIVAFVVLGGLGSLSGAILAAATLTAAPEVLRGIGEWRMVLYSLLLIVTMLLRPQGLLGQRELWPLNLLVRRPA